MSPPAPDPDPGPDRAGWLTLERTALGAVLALTFGIAMRPATDNDMWWHLRSGQLFVRHLWTIGPDPLSYTSGVTRPPSDWLSQVLLYLGWHVGGATAVSVGVAVLATVGCAFMAASTRGPALARAGMVALGAATSSLFWSARPQMVTFVGTCLVVWVLGRARRGIAPPWWLPLVFVVWSNAHLGWFYGALVLWAAIAGAVLDRRLGRSWMPACDAVLRRLVGVAAACTLAGFVNPVAWRTPRLILTQVSVGTEFLQENQPPDPSDPMTWPFYVLLVLTAAVLAVRWRHVRLAEALPVAGTAVAAVGAQRTVTLFAAVAVPVASWHLADLLDERRARRPNTAAAEPTAPAFNAALLLVTVVLAVALGLNRTSDAAVAESLRAEFPVAATAWILDAEPPPPGPLFNTFDWGGWFTWKLPEYPVSIDGRAELYADHLERYAQLEQGTGVPAELDRLRANLAVVPTGSALARAIDAEDDWQVAFTDERATVFVRTPPLPQD